MTVVRYEPWSLLNRLRRELDQTFEFAAHEASWTPAVDIHEEDKQFVVRADLPGVKQEDLEVSLTGNRLTVSGSREQERREQDEQYYTSERLFGRFSRSFTLPDGADPDRVQADLKDGVLTLSIPKRPEVQPKRITIGERAQAQGSQQKGKA